MPGTLANARALKNYRKWKNQTKYCFFWFLLAPYLFDIHVADLGWHFQAVSVCQLETSGLHVYIRPSAGLKKVNIRFSISKNEMRMQPWLRTSSSNQPHLRSAELVSCSHEAYFIAPLGNGGRDRESSRKHALMSVKKSSESNYHPKIPPAPPALWSRSWTLPDSSSCYKFHFSISMKQI